MSYVIVRCTYCGTTSRNQPEGDLCHACLYGVMREAAE
jgi:hypothetical protein